MTPSERAWIKARIAEWSERAASNRRIAATRDGPLNRAMCIELVVKRLQARLDAAPPTEDQRVQPNRTPANSSEIETLRQGIAALSPRPHPHYPSIMMGQPGSIVAAVRAELESRVAALTGDTPLPPNLTLFQRMARLAAASASVPDVPKPFTMGPQMELFA